MATSRTSESVAQAIRRAIVDQELLPGDVLPPERSLAEQFQVTRNTVREALRALEGARLLSIRQGSGARVLDYLSTAGLELFAELLGSDRGGQERLLRDLVEARVVVGGALCRYALERLDERSVVDLRLAVEGFHAEAERPRPDVRRLQELDYEVHSLLVRGSGNRAFLLLHNSLNHVYRAIAHLFEPLMAEPARLAALYDDMVLALEAGDQARAMELIDEVFAQGREAMLLALEDEARDE